MMSIKLWSFVLALTLLCVGRTSHAGLFEEKPLDPTTYYSATKKFGLKVVPSSRYGEGGAEYTFLERVKIQWNKKLEFTLRDVKITSTGIIAGYSYSKGFHGYANKDSRLSVWLLDRQGKTLYSWSTLRNMPTSLHSPDYPYCQGVMLHEKFANVIFRIYPASETEGGEEWMVISLETFKKKESIAFGKCKDELPGRFKEVIPIADHPLFLTFNEEWISTPSKATDHVLYARTVGTTFRIIDYKGNLVWIDKNPDDINHEMLGCKPEHLSRFRDDNPLLGAGTGPGEFWVLHLKEDEKVTHKIAEDRKIEVVRREKLNWKEAQKKRESDEHAATLMYHDAPTHLSSFQVGTKPEPGSLPEHIEYFDFDKQDNIGCIAFCDKAYFFYLISQENKVIAWKELDQKDWHKLRPSSLLKCTGDKWLLLLSYFEENPRLLVLSSEGEVEREIKIDFPGGERMANDENGNIAVLSTAGGKIRQFNARGKVLWTFDEYFGSSSSGPGALLSPEDIALTPDDELIVLDNIAQKAQYYSLQGKPLRTIDFEETKSGEIDYPTFISVNREGIVHVKESAGKHRIQRYSKEGKWLSSIRMRHKNGKSIGYIRDMRFDNGDNLWISDGVACRIAKEGNTTKVLGTLPPKDAIRNISAIDTDSKGNLYVYDDENLAVVSFGPDGKKRSWFSLPPREEEDYVLPGSPGWKMFVDSEDLINFSIANDSYVRFNSSGKEVDHKTSRGEKHWGISNRAIVLRDNKGQEILQIRKGNDGKRFESISDIYTDHLGQLLCYEYEDKAHVFDASGKPISSFTLTGKWKEFGQRALCGKHIYFTYRDLNLIRVTDLHGKEVALFPDPEKAPEGFSKPYLIHADARHKRVYVSDGKNIHVFELLPQGDK